MHEVLVELQATDPIRRRRGLERAYAALAGDVHRIAWSLVGAGAEDIVQQTFIAVSENAATCEGELRGWTLAIAANLSRRALVHAEVGRRALAARQERDAAAPAPPDPDATAELRQRLDRALRQLPPSQRLAITLSALDGLTAAEIATMLGCPEGTVWSRLHHAKRRLAAALADLAPRPEHTP
ncbi:MAG: sigma-70 family RNA polymerase sigma factor [Planctomycetota bacterium]